MYYANLPQPELRAPWEGVATAVDSKVHTSAEVMKEAKLDWPVLQEKLKTTGNKLITSHKALIRGDTNRVLGVVGSRYEVLQNSEVFAFADSLVDHGQMRYAGAGTFDEGKRIFVQCVIDRPANDGGLGSTEIAPGDPVLPFLLLANSHDGSHAVRAILTATRVRCQNTLNAALRDKSAENNISIKHTRSMMVRLEQAKEMFKWAERNYTNFVVAARGLAKKKVPSADRLNQFFAEVFEQEDEKTMSTRAKNRQERLGDLFMDGAGNKEPAVKGTVWAALNAVTQYLDHESNAPITGVDLTTVGPDEKTLMRRARRFESNMLGNNAKIKDRAFELALSI